MSGFDYDNIKLPELIDVYRQQCALMGGDFSTSEQSDGTHRVVCRIPSTETASDKDTKKKKKPKATGSTSGTGGGAFDHDAFLAAVKTAFASVSSEAREGLRAIVQEAITRKVERDQLAYILATAWWETARTMQPVREAFFLGGTAEDHRKTLSYYPYYGRGYVQLTHKTNYKKAGKAIGADLENDPDLALKPEHALKIMFLGMEKGWFTGKKLDDYIDNLDEDEKEDFREFEEARRIINGVDKKTTIAKIAVKFRDALKAANYRKKTAGSLISAAAASDFEAHIAALGLKHFRAAEFLVKGSQHSNPASDAFGMNADPPQALWSNIDAVASVLDRFRASVGKPVLISSAYRTKAYNKAIGGASESRHMFFNALDFSVRGSPVGPAEWAAELRQMRDAGAFKGGIGVYSSFVHIDARGENIDWVG